MSFRRGIGIVSAPRLARGFLANSSLRSLRTLSLPSNFDQPLGLNLAKLREHPDTERLEYEYVKFCCKQGMIRKSESKGLRPNQRTIKCDCESIIRLIKVKIDGRNVLQIKALNLEHKNHPPIIPRSRPNHHPVTKTTKIQRPIEATMQMHPDIVTTNSWETSMVMPASAIETSEMESVFETNTTIKIEPDTVTRNLSETRLVETNMTMLMHPDTIGTSSWETKPLELPGPSNFKSELEESNPADESNFITRRLTPSRSHKTEVQEENLTITSQVDGIRTICLNDPRKRNALSLAMLKSIKEDLLRDPDSLRVVIIKANGPVFSAGHDLKELTSETGRSYHEQVFSTCSSVMNLIQDLPVPVIAQVNGLATAAGCQLVASCDIAIGSESSKYATPGVSVGLFCTTPAVAVGRSVPRKVAMEMLFTGHPISAQDALLHGLLSRVVPDNMVEQEARKIAERICETSKPVAALGKASFYAQMALDRKDAYRFSERKMVENLSLRDGQEGIKAFIEKREPVWE